MTFQFHLIASYKLPEHACLVDQKRQTYVSEQSSVRLGIYSGAFPVTTIQMTLVIFAAIRAAISRRCQIDRVNMRRFHGDIAATFLSYFVST